MPTGWGDGNAREAPAPTWVGWRRIPAGAAPRPAPWSVYGSRPEMDEATTLSSGPPVRRGDPVAIDEAIRLSSGPLAGCVLAPATDAAMRLSSGTALGREPTDAATPLSSGPPSERTLGCDAEVLLALSAVPSELPAELVLGENTVKTRVAHLLSKLDLRDRVQAVVVAYETGLVAPELSPADGDLEA